MGSNDPRIEMYRWYAIVYFGDIELGVIAVSQDTGELRHYSSMEEYEEMNI
jgi:hypothetical protein